MERNVIVREYIYSCKFPHGIQFQDFLYSLSLSVCLTFPLVFTLHWTLPRKGWVVVVERGGYGGAKKIDCTAEILYISFLCQSCCACVFFFRSNVLEARCFLPLPHLPPPLPAPSPGATLKFIINKLPTGKSKSRRDSISICVILTGEIRKSKFPFFSCSIYLLHNDSWNIALCVCLYICTMPLTNCNNT